MRSTEAAKSLIKQFEGKKLQAYQDSAGVWTIGYGHTRTAKPGMRITDAEADRLLSLDIQDAENGVKSVIRVPLKQNQFDALTSFVFNVGSGNLGKSTLAKMVNTGNFLGAAKEFAKWVYAGGVALPGLVRRRVAEAELFSGGGISTVAVVLLVAGLFFF